MTTDPIHLVFCLFQRDSESSYPMALAATYSSIRQRTSASIIVHIIADDSVTRRTKRRLRRSIHSSDNIRFCSAQSVPEAYKLSRQLDGRYSPAIIWRAWIPEYLPKVERCIMLDCDLLFFMDIRRIWDIELNETYLSACPREKSHPKSYLDWIQTPSHNYFKVCLCLLNLSQIRNHKDFINNRENFLLEARRIQKKIPLAALLEQSLFNRYFSGNYLQLPFSLINANSLKSTPEKMKRIYKKLRKHEPLILDIRGWTNKSVFSLYFWSSLLHTPWRKCAERQLLRPPGPPRSEP